MGNGLQIDIGGKADEFRKACEDALKSGQGVLKTLSGIKLDIPGMESFSKLSGMLGGVNGLALGGIGVGATAAAAAIGTIASATGEYLERVQK